MADRIVVTSGNAERLPYPDAAFDAEPLRRRLAAGVHPTGRVRPGPAHCGHGAARSVPGMIVPTSRTLPPQRRIAVTGRTPFVVAGVSPTGRHRLPSRAFGADRAP
jgi:hypothetical protein